MNKASATTVLRIVITGVLTALFVFAHSSARPAADSPWDAVRADRKSVV